jgi:hypothetical protein
MSIEVVSTRRARQQADELDRLVAFESPRRACILLVGPHDGTDPNRDVYAERYGLLGAAPPEESGRGKPPCCGEDRQPPPGLGDDLADLIIRTAKQRRPRRQQARAQ